MRGVTERRVWIATVWVAIVALAVTVASMVGPWLRRHQVTARLAAILAGHTLAVVLAVAGTVALAVGLRGIRRTRAPASAPASAVRTPLRAMPGWFIPLGALAVGVITYVATVWLLDHISLPGGPEVERANLRIETIRTGLSVGAGTAGALALILAVRRQWLAERTQQSSEYDAAERRVTELYVKAADQLGSDKAPVRLAGLYALERLAQDNPNQRQTIVNVICAYLRMPYTPPSARGDERGATRHYGTMPGRPARPTPSATGDPREELQVRLTAQRILIDHLTVPVDVVDAAAARLPEDPVHTFWPGISLDLAGATLVDFQMTRCLLTTGTFARTTFTGNTRFGETTFTGDAEFDDARFTGDAAFDDAAFTRRARFRRVTFAGRTAFTRARFSSYAVFEHAAFTGYANFSDLTFAQATEFSQARFAGPAAFDRTTFAGRTAFNGVEFGTYAVFSKTAFADNAAFRRVRFTGRALFNGATFAGRADFAEVTFHSHIDLDGTRFHSVDFTAATMTNVDPRQPCHWPAGWRLAPAMEDTTGGCFVRDQSAVPAVEDVSPA